MTSTLGGDDPLHDLPGHVKDRLEKELRREARELLSREYQKERNTLLNRANEISRAKSKRAHKR